MKDIFFTWQGGEGGDFIMSILARFFDKNYKVQIDDNGKALEPEQFTTKNFNFFKSHLLWNDINYKQSTNKFVFFITNPDINMLLRKKIKKFLTNSSDMYIDIFTVSNHKFINRKILQSVKNNDLKNVYYYSHKSLRESYCSYFESTQKILKKVPHTMINTKLTTYKDVTDLLAIVSQKLGVDVEIDNDLRSYCLNYIEMQKQYEEEWPYLDY